MLVCYLPGFIFYAVVSGLSGRFIQRLYTWKKNHLCAWKKNPLCTWKKNGQYSQDACPYHALGIKEAPADHDTQNCCLGSMLNYVSILSFFKGSILWLYQTQGLFIICAPDTDVINNSCGRYSCTADNEKRKKERKKKEIGEMSKVFARSSHTKDSKNGTWFRLA